jgi:[acyl-carrier-protein] S-malonyltransferase
VSKIFDQADKQLEDILHHRISDICFKRPIGKTIRDRYHVWSLDKTIYTQPAVLVASYGCWKALDERCKAENIELNPSNLMGHSLGQYTALLISGALSFETALELVHERAKLATGYAGQSGSKLMAIVDKKNELDDKTLQALCREYHLVIAARNSKHQAVVGGPEVTLNAVSKKLKEEGKEPTILSVEVPFHTYLMREAADQFKEVLDDADIKRARRDIIANSSAMAIVDPYHIKEELHQQLYSCVLWQKSIEKVIDDGTDLFIEVGPRTIQSKIIKEIDTSAEPIPIKHVGDMKSLNETMDFLLNTE